MRLGLDLAPIFAARTGIPVFARTVLGGIVRARPDWTIQGFSPSGWRDARPVLAGEAGGSGEAGQARISSLALSLPGVARFRAALRRWRFENAPAPALDLFYAVNFVAPGDISCPVVPVVHDLYHLEEGAQIHPARRKVLDRLGRTAATAPRVQAVSAFTADRVMRHFGVPASRIDIVPPAVRPLFFADADLAELADAGLRPGGYWLAVGMAEKRKNMALLAGIAAKRSDLFTPDHPLVVTGPPPWEAVADRAFLAAANRSGRIRNVGFVNDRKLHALYSGARALLMPSLHEGFAIPVLEALASGTEVIAANAGAIPDTLGGNGLLLAPGDAGAWERALERKMRDEDDSPSLSDRRRHAEGFSEARTLAAALASLERAVPGSGG